MNQIFQHRSIEAAVLPAIERSVAKATLDGCKEVISKTDKDRAPLGIPLNLKTDCSRAIEALRAMGDYPPADKPNSKERPGRWPEPGGRYSLDAAIKWLNSNPNPWESEVV